MFQGMSPEDQARYNNEQGLETMALRALRVRDLDQSSRSGMAHSAPFGNAGMRPAPARQATEADIWNLSDDEFEAKYGQR
jgi:hypothetical protein